MLAQEKLSMPPVESINPKGIRHYWIGDSGTPFKSKNNDDDFASVDKGFISVSPITINNEFDLANISVK